MKCFNEFFLRGGGTSSVIADAIKLMLFFVFTMAIASFVNRVKRKI